MLLKFAQGLDFTSILILGTLGMLIMALALILVLVFHQRRVIKFHKQIQKMEEEKQQLLLHATLQSQEEERQRLAADLHDDAGPLLATARLYLNENLIHQSTDQQLQSIFSAKEIIDESIQLIRNISHSLLPPTLKNFGLEAAIKDQLDRINTTGAVKTSVRFYDMQHRLKEEYELHIFRILQELITNILKHSHAGFIHLIQNNQGNSMFFRLHHDGDGILQSHYDDIKDKKHGLGLKNIQSRLRVLQGKINFEIDQSHSFYKVTIEVPRNLMAKE